MLKRYMHKRERHLAMLNDNRVVRPFEWGLEFIGEDADKAKELDNALIELADSFGEAHGDAVWQMQWEYLLLTARKAR